LSFLERGSMLKMPYAQGIEPIFELKAENYLKQVSFSGYPPL